MYRHSLEVSVNLEGGSMRRDDRTEYHALKTDTVLIRKEKEEGKKEGRKDGRLLIRGATSREVRASKYSHRINTSTCQSTL